MLKTFIHAYFLFLIEMFLRHAYALFQFKCAHYLLFLFFVTTNIKEFPFLLTLSVDD